MSNQPPYGDAPQYPEYPQYPQQPGTNQPTPGQPPAPGYDPAGFPPPPQAYPQGAYPPATGQPYGGVVAAPDNRGGLAVAGFVLGIISLLAWLLPICGAPVAIIGLVLSILGRGSPTRRTLATIGLVLCIVGILLSVGNAAVGIYLAAQKLGQ